MIILLTTLAKPEFIVKRRNKYPFVLIFCLSVLQSANNSLFRSIYPEAPGILINLFHSSNISLWLPAAFYRQIPFAFCCAYLNHFPVHMDMYISVRCRYTAFHPFQTSQYRSYREFLIAFFHRFHSQVIFTEQINRTCSPSVAQALSVWAAIHGKMLCSAFLFLVHQAHKGLLTHKSAYRES